LSAVEDSPLGRLQPFISVESKGDSNVANYVDGFVVPVPKKKLKAYLKMAKTAGKVWREHGALEYYECIADDVQVGKVTSFPRSVKRKAGETVFFSWIIYKSRKHRDQVLKKVMNDPRMSMQDPDSWPFDGMRMIYGGFKPLVSL
jgi:uncharacterized protein YbaA (DUF1428 family)